MSPSRRAQDVAEVVVITGAAGGLGRALVEAFGGAGWRVAAAGHRTPPPAFTGEPGVWCTQADVTDPGAVSGLVAGVLERWGRVDVLVCNAGVTADRLLLQMDDASWDRVLDVNLKGAFLCARAVLDPMVRQGGGHILNVASLAGRSGARGQANYAAAKAGLIGLTLALAREVGGQGIRVNAILPGVLATAMTAGLSPGALEAFTQANVLGRLGDPRDVARTVVAIAGARGVSGQVFQLDSRIARWA